jgi:hypothetical protein
MRSLHILSLLLKFENSSEAESNVRVGKSGQVSDILKYD